jgi:hypothetical protein
VAIGLQAEKKKHKNYKKIFDKHFFHTLAGMD